MTDLDDVEDQIRAATEVASRALALFGFFAVSVGAPREETVGWLKQSLLWDYVSPQEASFLLNPSPSQREINNASWRSEALLMLLWSISKVESLPPANEQCNTTVFQELLPPYADVLPADFIAAAVLRSEEELFDMSNTCLDLHWKARDAQLNGRPAPDQVDIEIVQERHLAINWVTGYCGLPWDEVTTDT